MKGYGHAQDSGVILTKILAERFLADWQLGQVFIVENTV